MPGTNNVSEQILRTPAQNRRTDQTTRSVRGARRRTILTSVLESLRTRRPVFDGQSVLAEVSHWYRTGRSGFGRTLKKLGLLPRDDSPLDLLVPLPLAKGNTS